VVFLKYRVEEKLNSFALFRLSSPSSGRKRKGKRGAKELSFFRLLLVTMVYVYKRK